jgi:hypothetical protein
LSIIERILSGAKNTVEKIYSGYLEFQNARKVLSKNFNELFDYTSDSFRNVIYNDGTTGLYADFLQDQRKVCNKLWDVEDSINTLEGVLSSEDIGQKKFSRERPSRFKSAYISIVAGMGTTAKLYELLRLDNPRIIKYDNYSLRDINSLIAMKNKYFWKNEKQLIELIEKDKGLIVKSIDELVRDAMKLKVSNPEYYNITRINYDSRIASREMRDELTDAYIKSDKTLKEISLEFEKRYGMHVSVSTISVNARKQLQAQGLDFRNRREAKNYYKNMSL